MLTRTISTGVFGLRTSPSHPSLPGASQSATASTFQEASGKARVGSSAFDPLPGRPVMRRRSATTASLMTFSRITPAEVLDDAEVVHEMDLHSDEVDSGVDSSDRGHHDAQLSGSEVEHEGDHAEIGRAM
jgi:hypothetical protein